jgi:flavocytochrome c
MLLLFEKESKWRSKIGGEMKPYDSKVAFPSRWDEFCDVLIVGSGFAGLAAAVEAKRAASAVIVIEKMQGFGGNSTISEGGIAAPDTLLQREKGIRDSAEQMYADMMAAGLGLNHPGLVKTVVENAADTFHWTMETLNVRYKDRVDRFGGHSVARCYTTHNRSGSAIVRQLLAKLQELGMKVRTRTYLQRLLTDANGRVRGVKVREGYDFPDPQSGTPKYIAVRRAVVLAAGGFAGDIPFRTAQDPRLDEAVDATTKYSTTGESLKEAMRIGALPVHLSWIQLAPWACPDEKGYGIGPDFACYIALPHGILVNPKNGKRFVNELGNRRIRADAIFQAGAPCIALADANGVTRSGYSLERCLKKGIVKAFDSISGVAGHYGIPAGPLARTVERFNAHVCAGKDKDFGKPILDDNGTLDTPPYYAIRLWPKVHYTMGGALINERAQVLDLSKEPIEGLYAAGEFTGGMHGACRLGSCAITECLVFGRIAGRNAAAEPCAEDL